MAYTFDGASSVITISAQTVMSARDVYSRWVDWLTQADNTKFLPAFRTVGGDVIDAFTGTTIPIYCFLANGWRIRPMEANHTLSVTDGVLLVDGGGDPFLNTLGSFVVRINYQQPVQAITVATGGGGSTGLTSEQAIMLEEIWRIHGLKPGQPLQVAQNVRTTGSITQAITEAGNTTTVERV